MRVLYCRFHNTLLLLPSTLHLHNTKAPPSGHMWYYTEHQYNMINRFVFVCLDDILIFSQSLQEHQVHVRRVLQRLQENKLYVKAEKCEFHATTVHFLGYVISQGQLSMGPAKLKAVADWPAPMDRKKLQRFLGFANFI